MTEFEEKYNEVSAEIERIKAEVEAASVASEATDAHNNLQMHQQMHQQAAAEFNAQQLRDMQQVNMVMEQTNIQNIINNMMF